MYNKDTIHINRFFYLHESACRSLFAVLYFFVICTTGWKVLRSRLSEVEMPDISMWFCRFWAIGWIDGRIDGDG